jgi:hypothetical protein
VYKKTILDLKETKKKRIVIIGGSHSGFSAAWLLLNGPASYRKNTTIEQSKYEEFPEFKKCKIESCQNCQDPAACNCLASNFNYEPFDFDYNDLP